MDNFGKGPTLKDASPRLRDDRAAIERILTVTETNSVAEGFPPFDAETRERFTATHPAFRARARADRINVGHGAVFFLKCRLGGRDVRVLALLRLVVDEHGMVRLLGQDGIESTSPSARCFPPAVVRRLRS